MHSIFGFFNDIQLQFLAFRIIISMFEPKDFVRHRFVAQISTKICVCRSSRISVRHRTKSLSTNIGTISKNMPTNFDPKQLKLKRDIIEKPENWVHRLTDSNWTLNNTQIMQCTLLKSKSKATCWLWLQFLIFGAGMQYLSKSFLELINYQQTQ